LGKCSIDLLKAYRGQKIEKITLFTVYCLLPTNSKEQMEQVKGAQGKIKH